MQRNHRADYGVSLNLSNKIREIKTTKKKKKLPQRIHTSVYKSSIEFFYLKKKQRNRNNEICGSNIPVIHIIKLMCMKVWEYERTQGSKRRTRLTIGSCIYVIETYVQYIIRVIIPLYSICWECGINAFAFGRFASLRGSHLNPKSKNLTKQTNNA